VISPSRTDNNFYGAKMPTFIFELQVPTVHVSTCRLLM